jgi:hypothetical protein
VFREGKGQAAVEATVGRVATPVPASEAAPLRSHAPYDLCTVQHIPSGATLEVLTSYVNPGSPHAIRCWTAILTTSHGEQVFLSECDAVPPTALGSSRQQPPLTTAQLVKAISSDIWTSLASELPQPSQPPAPLTTPELTEQQILSGIRKQLPARLQAADEEGAPLGYVDLTLADGHGKSLLQALACSHGRPADLDGTGHPPRRRGCPVMDLPGLSTANERQ